MLTILGHTVHAVQEQEGEQEGEGEGEQEEVQCSAVSAQIREFGSVPL
jgi:hypothetical protein